VLYRAEGNYAHDYLHYSIQNFLVTVFIMLQTHALFSKLFPINQCEIGKTLLVALAKQLDIGLIVRSPALYNSIR